MNSLFLKCVLITTLLQPLFLFGSNNDEPPAKRMKLHDPNKLALATVDLYKIHSYACGVCDDSQRKTSTFSTADEAVKHIKDTHAKEVKSIRDTNPTFPVPEALVVLEIDSDSGSNYSDEESDSDDNDDNRPRKSRFFPCKTCGQLLPHNMVTAHAQVHVESETHRHTCKKCNKSGIYTGYTKKGNLQRHEENVHEKKAKT